jgi:hypothetical protein
MSSAVSPPPTVGSMPFGRQSNAVASIGVEVDHHCTELRDRRASSRSSAAGAFHGPLGALHCRRYIMGPSLGTGTSTETVAIGQPDDVNEIMSRRTSREY